MFQSHSLLFIDNNCAKKNDNRAFLQDSPRDSLNQKKHKIFHIKIIKSPRAAINTDHFFTIGEFTNKKYSITRKPINNERNNLSSDSISNIQPFHSNRFIIQKIHHKTTFIIKSVPKNAE